MKWIALGFAIFWSGLASAEILHEERSLYQRVFIVEEDGLRCLRFRKRNDDHTSQSCVDLDAPRRLVFDYYRQAMAGVLMVEDPQRILVVGLGGGVLTKALRQVFPHASIDAVEIDPVVVKMARSYFDFDDAALDVSTAVADGRVYVKRAGRRDRRYDLILLDAFNGDYIPEHMMTREFLAEVKAILSDAGVVVANTYSTSALFHHESATYQDVFGQFYQVRLPESDLSRVIVASNAALPEVRSLLPRANALRPILQQFGIDVLTLFDSIQAEVNWNTEARVLTDQYSPANLLNEG